MTSKTTATLGWLTLLAILGALWVLFGEDPTKDPGARGGLLFDGLGDQITAVNRIEVKREGAQTVLVRVGDIWTVQDRGGYPADAAAVRGFLRSVVRSTRREPKTTNKDRFPAIGLGSAATNVTLYTGAGQAVAALQLGNRRALGDRSLTYVFKPGDSRAWVVSDLTEAYSSPADWLKPGLLSLDLDSLTRLSLGNAALVRLGDAYTLEDLVDGEALKPSFSVNEPVRVFASLGFLDVVPMNNPLMDPVRTLTATTVDGLEITVTLYQQDDQTLAQLSATAVSSAPQETVDQAAALTARTNGYLFVLEQSDTDALLRERGDFIDPEGSEELFEERLAP